MTHDAVNNPKHYTQHPTGVECIDIIEHWPANLANAVKYIWRHGLKGGTHAKTIEDLKKAAWYINREIERRNALAVKEQTTGAYKCGKPIEMTAKEVTDRYQAHIERYG